MKEAAKTPSTGSDFEARVEEIAKVYFSMNAVLPKDIQAVFDTIRASLRGDKPASATESPAAAPAKSENAVAPKAASTPKRERIAKVERPSAASETVVATRHPPAPRAASTSAAKHDPMVAWPDIDRKTRDKFARIVSSKKLRWDPKTHKPMPLLTDLISDDRMQVQDPINGRWYSMLKHHIRTSYDLSHDELLAMFGLTEEQLPQVGPNYSLSKAQAAKEMGLGTVKMRKTAQAA